MVGWYSVVVRTPCRVTLRARPSARVVPSTEQPPAHPHLPLGRKYYRWQWCCGPADPDSDPRFCWPKFENKIKAEIKFIFFWSKIVIRLCLGLHKGRPSYSRSLHPSKKPSSNSKREFSSLLWAILALLDPDPKSYLNADQDPDPADQNECGSGSATPAESLYFG